MQIYVCVVNAMLTYVHYFHSRIALRVFVGLPILLAADGFDHLLFDFSHCVAPLLRTRVRRFLFSSVLLRAAVFDLVLLRTVYIVAVLYSYVKL